MGFFLILCFVALLSLELECQFENAQSRAQILEKQLEYMRKMMQNQTTNTPRTRTENSSPVVADSPIYSVTTTQQLANSSVRMMSAPFTTTPEKHENTSAPKSPAMEKLNDLEMKHIKLTASQNLTEVYQSSIKLTHFQNAVLHFILSDMYKIFTLRVKNRL